MKAKSIRNIRLGIYAFSHFCVDFSCFFMLFSWYSNSAHSLQTITMGFLAYNVIAFGFQPIIGYLCDTYKKIPITIIGCPVIVIGLLFMSVPAVSIFLIGLGNACFHIAGGIDTLRQSGGKMAKSGIFVSFGALGVAMGSLSGESGKLTVYFPIGILLICLILLYVFCIDVKKTESKFTISNPKLKFEAVIILAFISILIRSYAGSIIPTEWKTTPVFTVFPAIGAFLGKSCGGFIADKIGARKAAVYSLLTSLVLLGFGHANPWVYLIGIALFNINTSVTLCATASVLPLHPGLAFGITTIALLCGNVPTFFIAIAYAPLVFAALTAVSAICLYCIVKKES